MDTSSLEQLRELVAHAWFTIGYPPARSLVLVEVHDGGGLGVVARIDQPPPAQPGRGQPEAGGPRVAPAGHLRAAAEMLASTARRGAVRAVVVLVVQDPSGAGEAAFGRPEAALVRAVRQALGRARVRVVSVVLVGSGRVRSLDCTDPACCPPGGAPLGDLAATSTAADMVLRGRVLAADEAALVADVEPRPWPEAVLTTEPPPAVPPLGLARWRTLLQARLAAPRPGRLPLPAEVAWLVAGLRDVRLRDAVLVSLLPPPGAALTRRALDPAADLAAGRVESVPDLSAATSRPPDPQVFEAARALLAQVARGAPAGSRAEALAVLAWMAWWEGSSARGRLLVGLALADEPAHRLAGIVDQLLAYGVPPSWVLPLRPGMAAARERDRGDRSVDRG